MSITITFTDLQAGVLHNLMAASNDITDIDYKVLNEIYSKVYDRVQSREKEITKAMDKYNETIKSELL